MAAGCELQRRGPLDGKSEEEALAELPKLKLPVTLESNHLLATHDSVYGPTWSQLRSYFATALNHFALLLLPPSLATWHGARWKRRAAVILKALPARDGCSTHGLLARTNGVGRPKDFACEKRVRAGGTASSAGVQELCRAALNALPLRSC